MVVPGGQLVSWMWSVGHFVVVMPQLDISVRDGRTETSARTVSFELRKIIIFVSFFSSSFNI